MPFGAVTRIDRSLISVLAAAGFAALVDGEGERFLNEDTYTGRIGQQPLYEAEGQAFWLVDEALHEAIDGRNVVGMRVQWVAETVEELAAEIGVPAGALARTVERYNGFVADGADADFGKANESLVPMRPPLRSFTA